MSDVITWAPGDPCPGCGGVLTPRRAATPAEFAAFTDRENPRPLPAGVDNANAEQRAALGELHVCGSCGYKARHKPGAEGEVRDDGAAGSERSTPRRSTKKTRGAAATTGE